jgi:hypothetical protein
MFRAKRPQRGIGHARRQRIPRCRPNYGLPGLLRKVPPAFTATFNQSWPLDPSRCQPGINLFGRADTPHLKWVTTGSCSY